MNRSCLKAALESQAEALLSTHYLICCSMQVLCWGNSRTELDLDQLAEYHTISVLYKRNL